MATTDDSSYSFEQHSFYSCQIQLAHVNFDVGEETALALLYKNSTETAWIVS